MVIANHRSSDGLMDSLDWIAWGRVVSAPSWHLVAYDPVHHRLRLSRDRFPVSAPVTDYICITYNPLMQFHRGLSRVTLKALTPSIFFVPQYFSRLSVYTGGWKEMFNRGLSPRTIEYTNAVPQFAFRPTVRWKMFADDPCVRVDPPRIKLHKMESGDGNRSRLT